MRLIRSGDKHFTTLTGVAGIIDLFGTEGYILYNQIKSKSHLRTRQSDCESIKSDWANVGNSLTIAIHKAQELYGSRKA